MARAGELGVDQALSFLREVDASTCAAGPGWSTWPGNGRRNLRRPDRGRPLGPFKPESDDIRDSPALDVAATIHELGTSVTV